MEQYLVPVYGTYIVCAVVLTAFLARTLHRNGSLFLRDTFEDRPDLADAVNRLLVTGFFMLNLGYAFFLMRARSAADSTEAVEVLARKLGVLLCSLAIIHFANLYVFHRLGQRRRQRSMLPPVAPQGWTTPMAGYAPPAPTAGR